MPIAAVAYSQKATYWGAPVQSGFGGWTFNAPQLINCRWEESTEQFIDKDGNETISNAVVWTFDLLDEDGYLAKGDHTARTDPTAYNEAYPIRRTSEIPDLRALNFERKAFL